MFVNPIAVAIGVITCFPLILALPTFDSVRFFLYPDPWNLDYTQEIIPGDSKSLLTSKYNKWHFPVILIHGYGQNYSTSFPQLTKDAFLKQKLPVNVIVADWSGIIQKLNVVVNRRHGIHGPLTTVNADLIGKRVGEFIVFLINHGVLTDPTRVHLVGFSLGAQISGIAGQHAKHYTGRPIQRITGLDPAGPLFHFHAIKGKRLDHSDAYFVDVVHSNQGRYGIAGNNGHVDFFPNGGGPEQPGCTPRSDIPGLPGSCPHVRAWEYFTETILGSKIWACKAISYKDYNVLGNGNCHDKILFGLKVPPTARGSYYFDIVRNDPGSPAKISGPSFASYGLAPSPLYLY
ncbi:Pancreatic triacylglycerol lipase [Orchesella cincta]|uniref:Pancreatic triacylglycerol lipase n=1 Tax=Orchesella cincta TaxID=48709 RepID=A0A1D2NB05_ORCCI|nr:Pancreatic triacylglycerol lipase [Orchesella cincta]